MTKIKELNAHFVGMNYGLGFLQDFCEHPEHYPKGINSLADMAKHVAMVSLFQSCTWKPTKEEEEICGDTAYKVVSLAVELATKK